VSVYLEVVRCSRKELMRQMGETVVGREELEMREVSRQFWRGMAVMVVEVVGVVVIVVVMECDGGMVMTVVYGEYDFVSEGE
jgi:hypothetical protein